MPTKYVYLFYEGNEETISATFETAEPLPHLTIGARLYLETDDYSQKSRDFAGNSTNSAWYLTSWG